MPPGIKSNIEDPFPGLRPFEPEESHLFFGREGHAEALLDRLEHSRFVAVVGTSGSGKSSLVKAGLFPALYGGTITAAGSSWKIAEFRPAGDPIGELAGALSSPDVLRYDDNGEVPERLVVETILRQSSLGLVDAVESFLLGTCSNPLEMADRVEGTKAEAEDARGKKHSNLLVFVDQFEELFRLQKPGSDAKDDAVRFVKLLLEAINQQSLSIYVLLTMRSEYLGHCSRFYGLPEALNDNQYLVPRLTRNQFREAIVGPISVCGAEIKPRLVDRLLNDLGRPEEAPKDGGDEPDRLPLLQHALMRAWDYWRTHQPLDGPARPLDFEDYDNEQVGTITRALSNHATLAYAELQEPSGRRQQIAKKLFQAITEKTPNQPESRRPTSLKEICEIAEARESEVIDVIDHFRAKGRAFLKPPYERKLESNSMIDISHESLIRQWDTLAGWVDDEARSREFFKRIVDAARQFEEGAAGEWADPQLEIHLNWWKREKPNGAWAQRYFPDSNAARGQRDAIVSAQNFLEKSQQKRDNERRLRETAARRKRNRLYLTTGVSLVVAFIFFVLFWLAYGNYKKALATTFEMKLRGRVSGPVENVILAEVTAMNLDPSTENEWPLRKAMDLLPTIVWSIGPGDPNPGKYRPTLAVTLSGDESYVASAGADGLGYKFNLTSKVSSNYRECERLDMGTPDSDPKSGNYIAVAAAFNRDGRYLAVGCADRTVRVFDVTTGDGKTIIQLPQGSVTTLAFSPDNYYLAVGSSAGKVLVQESGLPRELVSVLSSSPGDSVCGGVQLVGTSHPSDEAADESSPPSPHQAVITLAFSPDSRYFAAAWVDGTAQVFEAGTGKPAGATLQLPNPVPVWAVAFYPKNINCLVTASDDNIARLWNWENGFSVKEIPHKAPVLTLAFSPNGNDLATGSADGMAHVWHLATNADSSRLPTNLPEGAKPINSVAFSPNGHFLATGSGDGTVQVWDVNSEAELSHLTHLGEVTEVTFGPKGSHVALAGADGVAQVFDFETNTFHLRSNDNPDNQVNPVRAVDFSANGQWIAVGSADGIIKVWKAGNETRGDASTDVDSRLAIDLSLSAGSTRNVTRKQAQTSQRSFTAMDLSADGLHLAKGYDTGTARVYEMQADPSKNLKLLSVVDIGSDGHWSRRPPGVASAASSLHETMSPQAVTSVCLSRDGRFLAIAIGSQNPDRTVKTGTVEVCDLSTNKTNDACRPIPYLHQVRTLAFSPDNEYLAIGSVDWKNNGMLQASKIEVFDSSTLSSAQVDWGDNGLVNTVAFSPDNKYLAVGGEGNKAEGELKGVLKVYDVANDKKVVDTSELELGPTVIVFSPDSSYVATGDAEGRAHAFEVGTWKETSEQAQGMLVGLAFRKDGGSEKMSKDLQLVSATLNSTEPNVLTIKYHGKIQDAAEKACTRLTHNFTKKDWRTGAGGWSAYFYRRTCPNLPWPDDCQHLRFVTCY